MNWGSREECHCPSTVWGGKNFWPSWYTKKYLIRCQISRSKTRYIVFQHKSLFNLVKDLFKWIEGLGRSVTVRVQSEGERIFDLGGIRKDYLIRCQISRSKTLYIVFQHRSLFNLVKDLFKWIEGLGRSVIVRVQSEGERIFDLGGIRKEYLIRCQILRSKTLYIVFQHKSLFNVVKDLIKWIEGLGRSVTVRVQSEGERIFDLGGIREEYLIRCQISRSKTLYIVFQHRSLFNLVKDLFKWIEALGRSVTVRVQSEGERIFDLGGIQKKYLIRCQISRSKTRYIVFQHKSLFNLVKDLFKWIEGLGRSVTVRVQSEGERFFDLGGIRKEYLICCQISRSKTLYIAFQHKSLFNLVKELFKWIEGLGRSVTVRVQSEGERIFDLGGIRKKYLIRCQISRSKTRYIVFQHKSLFNLVKDLFKWIEGLGRSVTVRVQSEGERIFDLGGIRKDYLIRCQISRSKTLYIVFQHRSLFNLVKDLFKWIEGLGRSVIVRVQSEGERIFDLGGIRKEYLIRCQILRSKTLYIVFQHKSLFNVVKDLIKWIEGLGRSVTVRVQSEGERIFDLGGIREEYLIRCQISRSKTLYIVFQHRSLFNLVKDLFKWPPEALGRSVTVRVQSEGERIFDLGGIQKKYLIRCQISRSKTRYIVFQHKSLFNLVKDLFKWIEGLGRSVTLRVQSEGERFFDLGGIRKEYLICCQISRSKTLYIAFQHRSLFNLVKDLFKWIEGLGRSVIVRVQSEGERIFDLGGIREEYLIRCQISRSKTLYIVFQHRSLFNLVKDLFKWIEALGRSVTVRVQSEGERIFDLGGIQKKYLIRCQISRSKTRYIVFQHKSLFNLVKDLFVYQWIEGLGRSVTLRVQSEGERFFDLGGIRKEYLICCQISRSKTLYIAFQHRSLFNLVKDLFKWIEGLGRSVTVRVQSEGERIFDLGGIRKEYLIRCQISRSKTLYIVFQHKSLFNLVKDLFKWIEGLGRSVTVRVQSEGERIFDLGGIRKKYLIRCQISRSKTLYIVFQHKWLFNLVKDLCKWIERLGRSVTVRVQSEGERIFDLGGIRKEYLIRCQISRSKTLYIVF